MEKAIKNDNIIKLYNMVKVDYPMLNYSYIIESPDFIKVVYNYELFSKLLGMYGIVDYLDNPKFRYSFIKAIFEGNYEILEENFLYLEEVKLKYQINILDDVEKLSTLLLYNGSTFAKTKIVSLQFVHSYCLDTIPSDFIEKQLGTKEEFNYVLDAIASNEKVPVFFESLFPIFNFSSKKYYLLSDTDFDNLLFRHLDTVIRRLVRMMLTGDSKYSEDVRLLFNADVKFLSLRYFEDINNESSKNYIFNLMNSSFGKKFFGCFHILYNRLKSIDKNLIEGGYSTFDYFCSPVGHYDKTFEERFELLHQMVASLDNYAEYSDFSAVQLIEYDNNYLDIINELSSKLHLFSYIYNDVFSCNNEKFFVQKYKTVNVLMCLAQIKKDEIDGLITKEEAISKVKKLIFIFYRKKNKNPQLKFTDYFFDNPEEVNEYRITSITKENFSCYALLANGYFDSIKFINEESPENCEAFDDIYDFILKTISVKNNKSDDFSKLIERDPNLINFLKLDKIFTGKELEQFYDLYERFKISSNITYLSSINNNLSSSFDFSLINSENLSIEQLNEYFDSLAVRYHSRLVLSDFYSSTINGVGYSNCIYDIKNKFKKGEFSWPRDRIHILIYCAYLENNLAHDVSESVFNYMIKDDDFFSTPINKNKKDDLFISIRDILQVIKNNNPHNVWTSIFNNIYDILCNVDDSGFEKREKLIGLIKDEKLVEVLLSIYDTYGSDFLTSYFLVIEEDYCYKNKIELAKQIVNQFYCDLFEMRKESYDSSTSFVLSIEETKDFYNKYGYLIDIRVDNNERTGRNAVIDLIDKNFDVVVSIHLKGVKQIAINSCNSNLILVDGVESCFSYFLKTSSTNGRQELLLHDDKGFCPYEDEILSDLGGNTKFYNHPNIDYLIQKYSLMDYFSYHEAFRYICCCLKKYNEIKINDLQPSIRQKFSV